MEGILIDAAAFGSVYSFWGGMLLLAAAVCIAILGHVSDGERRSERFHWAEWPLPEKEKEKHADDREDRMAA